VQVLPHRAFLFNSPGGNPFGAYDVAEWITKNNFDTVVGDNGECTSACVIVWAAGVHKFVSATAKIGVHNASSDTKSLIQKFVARVRCA
jgi:hypothetical protein